MTSLLGADGLGWPPQADEYFLPAGQHRPVMQGDVFDRVPFVKGARGNSLSDAPNKSAKPGLVVVPGHPCDMYLNGRLAKVQLVAPVRSAERLGIPENLDGAFTFAPLPDLLGDGQMHAADLRVAANIDAFYLDTRPAFPRPVMLRARLGGVPATHRPGQHAPAEPPRRPRLSRP